jgi:hypothetical protein
MIHHASEVDGREHIQICFKICSTLVMEDLLEEIAWNLDLEELIEFSQINETTWYSCERLSDRSLELQKVRVNTWHCPDVDAVEPLIHPWVIGLCRRNFHMVECLSQLEIIYTVTNLRMLYLNEPLFNWLLFDGRIPSYLLYSLGNTIRKVLEDNIVDVRKLKEYKKTRRSWRRSEIIDPALVEQARKSALYRLFAAIHTEYPIESVTYNFRIREIRGLDPESVKTSRREDRDRCDRPVSWHYLQTRLIGDIIKEIRNLRDPGSLLDRLDPKYREHLLLKLSVSLRIQRNTEVAQTFDKVACDLLSTGSINLSIVGPLLLDKVVNQCRGNFVFELFKFPIIPTRETLRKILSSARYPLLEAWFKSPSFDLELYNGYLPWMILTLIEAFVRLPRKQRRRPVRKFLNQAGQLLVGTPEFRDMILKQLPIRRFCSDIGRVLGWYTL